MGFFGGDNEGQANELVEQQISQNNAEIEQKRQSIAKERLDILKSQGAPRWTPEPLATTISPQQAKINQTAEVRKKYTGGVA